MSTMPFNTPPFGTPPQQQSPGGSFQERLRMSNIFQPQQQPPTGMGQYDPNMYMNQQGAPVEQGMPATDRLMELAGNYPEAEQPGMLKKIAASMIALRDPRLAMGLLQQPSAEQVAWENQMRGAETAADAEQRMREFKDRAAGRDIEGRRADISERRLDFDIDRFEQALTPEEEHALELEKIRVTDEGDIAEVERRAELARETGNLTHSRTLEAIAERGKEARITVAARGAETRKSQAERQQQDKEENQLDRGRRIENNIREYRMRHPEDADWFEEQPDGSIGIREARTEGSLDWNPFNNRSGAPIADEVTKREQIINAVMGEGSPTPAPVPQQAQRQTRVSIWKDGQEFTVPADQVEEAVATQGYTREP